MQLLEGTMKRKFAKRSKKGNKKRRKVKTYSKKNGYAKTVDLQKIVSFKFQTLTNFYKNFTEKQKIYTHFAEKHQNL